MHLDGEERPVCQYSDEAQPPRLAFYVPVVANMTMMPKMIECDSVIGPQHQEA